MAQMGQVRIQNFKGFDMIGLSAGARGTGSGGTRRRRQPAQDVVRRMVPLWISPSGITGTDR